MHKASWPSLGACLCVIFSTHGVFSVCRRSSETLRWYTFPSSFFSCFSVVPSIEEKEAWKAAAQVLHTQQQQKQWKREAFSYPAYCLLTDISSSPLATSDIWRSFYQSHTSADVLRVIDLYTESPTADSGAHRSNKSSLRWLLWPPQAVFFRFAPLVCIEETFSRFKNSDRLDISFTVWWWYLMLLLFLSFFSRAAVMVHRHTAVMVHMFYNDKVITHLYRPHCIIEYFHSLV